MRTRDFRYIILLEALSILSGVFLFVSLQSGAALVGNVLNLILFTAIGTCNIGLFSTGFFVKSRVIKTGYTLFNLSVIVLEVLYLFVSARTGFLIAVAVLLAARLAIALFIKIKKLTEKSFLVVSHKELMLRSGSDLEPYAKANLQNNAVAIPLVVLLLMGAEIDDKQIFAVVIGVGFVLFEGFYYWKYRVTKKSCELPVFSFYKEAFIVFVAFAVYFLQNLFVDLHDYGLIGFVFLGAWTQVIYVNIFRPYYLDKVIQTELDRQDKANSPKGLRLIYTEQTTKNDNDVEPL
ncbi:MAG: hypothetical protein LBT30_01015 [Clostridiales bacterium]|jgi:hypothetical protein|nr:hypothetical protein [Clostridiales bacterium]